MDAPRATALPSPLDPAVAGWFVTPRALLASSLFESLTAEGWRVAFLVLLVLPRFRDEEHWFGPHRFIVKRGELFHAEEEIARLAHVSRKVVRTVLRRLEEAHLVARRRVHPSGQCPHIVTVLDYELSQTLPTSGANGRANGGAIDRASEGPEAGQRGAPSKPQGTEGEPHEPPNPSPSPTAPARRGKGVPDPRHHPLQQLLEATFLELRGTTYGHQGGRDGKAVAELLRLSAGAADEVDRRWRRALSLERYPGCASFVLLAQRWNELSTTTPRANGAPVPAMAAGALGQTGGFGR